jgi:hypothetical protein
MGQALVGSQQRELVLESLNTKMAADEIFLS